MKIRAVFFLALLFTLQVHAGSDSIAGRYVGTMATEQEDEPRFLEVTIKQDGQQYLLSGGAGYSTGRSAAPDFEGQSRSAAKPPYTFDFEDSFGNVGIAVITPTKAGLQFSATITTIREARCLPLYESMEIRRKGD